MLINVFYGAESHFVLLQVMDTMDTMDTTIGIHSIDSIAVEQ